MQRVVLAQPVVDALADQEDASDCIAAQKLEKLIFTVQEKIHYGKQRFVECLDTKHSAKL